MKARTGVIMLFAAMVFAASPASAQVVQSLHFGGGFFGPKGFDSRAEGDVLVRDAFGEFLPGFPSLSDALAFEMRDFRGGQVFAEWTATVGERVEIGAGVSLYQRSVPTVYYDLVDEFGDEIDQTLRLRVAPITAVVRFLPFGRAGDVQPYVGAGVGLFSFRYSETGRFVDPETLDIYEDRFTTTGTVPGAVVLGGLRVPLGGDVFGLTLEGRYHIATGKTGGIDNGFLDEKIDLGGGQFNIGFLVRF